MELGRVEGGVFEDIVKEGRDGILYYIKSLRGCLTFAWFPVVKRGCRHLTLRSCM